MRSSRNNHPQATEVTIQVVTLASPIAATAKISRNELFDFGQCKFCKFVRVKNTIRLITIG